MAGAPAYCLEDFLWVIGSLCQWKRIPFDASLLRQQFAPPYDQTTLIAAASALGFNAGIRKTSVTELHELPVPWLAMPKSNAGESEAARPVLVVSVRDSEFTCFSSGATTGSTVGMAEFAARFEQEVLLFAHEAPPPVDDDLPAKRSPFGFSWFVPELLKHKRIWAEVLAASLAIQLVALATPLGTQIVIDKVVAHHTTSTLWVVGVALLMFMVFAAVMGWMRQYLVLHTGNRVDAVLGQAVFRHLFRLKNFVF